MQIFFDQKARLPSESYWDAGQLGRLILYSLVMSRLAKLDSVKHGATLWCKV